MLDDAAILLLRTRQEARHIFKSDQRNVEGIAEAHETRALHAGIDVERPRQVGRLIGHHTHRPAIQPREAHHDVFGEVLVDFQEVAIVENAVNHVFDVVRLVGFGRYQ